MKIKVAIFGIKGRLGASISSLCNENPYFEVVGGVESKRTRLGEKKVELSLADLWIDVSTSGLTDHLFLARELQKPIVIGTTGLSDEDHRQIKETSHSVPVFYASNFSKGIFLLKQASKYGLQFGGDIDLIEAHHAQKKDRPSGTALSLAQSLDSRQVHIHSLRAGSIRGEHTLQFTNGPEKLILSHEVLSRRVFAQGALDAARFLYETPLNLYSMNDLFAEEVYLGLGGNLGSPIDTLSAAIEKIKALENVKVLKVSSFYRTSPVSDIPQGDFINSALKLITNLSPIELHYFLQEIERELGNDIKEKNGPRHIDIDILLFGKREVQHPYLQIPHPRFKERLFVLKPLSEIVNNLSLSPTLSLEEHLKSFTNPHGETVTKV